MARFDELALRLDEEVRLRTKQTRIRCGLEVRAFCGHCENGVPLVRKVAATAV
jgi:hypothetical protein